MTRRTRPRFSTLPVGLANAEETILLVLSENARHEIEEHVMVKEEEFPVDALHMDAERQFVQVEGRLSSQARMKEQLAYHVHDPTGGTQEREY